LTVISGQVSGAANDNDPAYNRLADIRFNAVCFIN
jgi:hypothetical protein